MLLTLAGEVRILFLLTENPSEVFCQGWRVGRDRSVCKAAKLGILGVLQHPKIVSNSFLVNVPQNCKPHL